MSKQKEKLILKVFFGLFAFIIFNSHSFSYIMANRGDCAFGGGGEKGGSIKSYIIEGAGYFLNSYSDSLLFLNRIEMSEMNGIDYKELKGILYKAIENMENARDAYSNLKQTADNTPYNQAFINQLLYFDYAGFQKKRGLNNAIFKTVESYLRKGDVRGFFTLLLSRSEKILNQLYTIKEWVDTETYPLLSTLWRINQDYSITMLFGQYAADIFYTCLCFDKGILK